MTANSQWTVWCDDCSTWTYTEGRNAQTSRREVRASGWTVTRDPERGLLDHCPDCAPVDQEGQQQ